MARHFLPPVNGPMQQQQAARGGLDWHWTGWRSSGWGTEIVRLAGVVSLVVREVKKNEEEGDEWFESRWQKPTYKIIIIIMK